MQTADQAMLHLVSKVGWLIVTPSNVTVLLLVFGCSLMASRRTRTALSCIGTSAILLTGCTLLPVGDWLLQSLENRFAGTVPPRVDGIIVLGGATEPVISAARGGLALNAAAERPIAFADLARRFPSARLVFSGGYGQLPPASVSEADIIRRMASDLGIDPQRVLFEDRSRNTYENAAFSKQLAAPDPGETWLLVTSAYHMPRAMGVFAALGWTVTPYPVDFRTTGDVRISFNTDISMAERFGTLDVAVREYIALVVYSLLGRTNEILVTP